MIFDLGLPAIPHLDRWMSGDDAILAEEASECVIVRARFEPTIAAAALPVIVKNRRHFDVNRHYSFAAFVAQAGPAASLAADLLIECLQTYRRQTTDSDELEKLKQSPWSRYSYSAQDRMTEVLAAFRAIGASEAQKAVPVLLSLYEDEPIKTEWFVKRGGLRTDALETLNVLGMDLRALAAKWVPQLVAPLELDFELKQEVSENILELGAYGQLARSAVPELIRYARLRKLSREQALKALGRIAPEDERVRALLHVAKFEHQY